MKNLYIYLTTAIVVALSLIPPIDFVIQNPPNEYWLWMILLAGFAGVYTLFIKTNVAVKVIAIGSFILCFGSAIPYVSFTSYVSLVLCCYLYIMASRIENWNIVMQALQAIVILDLLIFCMQYMFHDPLLNFGLKHVEHFGTLGQHMQMGSFGIIITAILINYTKANFFVAFLFSILCKSSWAFMAAAVGLCVNLWNKQKLLACILMGTLMIVGGVWAHKDHKISNLSGRCEEWTIAIKLSHVHPFKGFGIGSFKDIFHPLSHMNTQQWRQAHNFIIQLIFEVGYPATGCLLIALGCFIWRLYRLNQWLLLSGSSMIITDALVHFPDRMLQTFPMIVIFLAYCSFTLKRCSYESTI